MKSWVAHLDETVYERGDEGTLDLTPFWLLEACWLLLLSRALPTSE